jgi:hypothetical protein
MIDMTSIDAALATLVSEQTALQAALTKATAQGTQSYNVATATRTATAAVQAITAATTTEQAQVASGDTAVTAALAARAAALAAFTSARSAGAHPPLADPQAATLKTAVATANGVSEGDLDSKGVAAVTTTDDAITNAATQETTDLATAQTTFATAQADLVTKRSAALALLAGIQGSAADITGRLSAALANFTTATQSAAAADAASHHTAVVAYADYNNERTSLASEVTADPDGTVAQGKWTTAANDWLTALAAFATANEAVVAKQLALDAALARKAAKQQARNGDAAAAVATAFGP